MFDIWKHELLPFDYKLSSIHVAKNNSNKANLGMINPLDILDIK